MHPPTDTIPLPRQERVIFNFKIERALILFSFAGAKYNVNHGEFAAELNLRPRRDYA